jgi:hypothetical protein
MSTLADVLKNPNAYRGACGDLCAGALRLSPQELADLTLQVAGQNPQRARQIVAEHLSKAAAGEETTPKPPATPQPPLPAQPPQPDPVLSNVAHVRHLPPAPQLDLPAKPPTPKFTGTESRGHPAHYPARQ